MKHRLSLQPYLHAMYQDAINKDIDKGYIRKLGSHEIPTTGCILPEHGVYSHVKAKLRRVSNAAAKFKERVSLTCSSQVPSSSQTLLESFYAFARKKFQFPRTSKACTCKFRSEISSGEPKVPKCTNTFAMSSVQNARLHVLIILFRPAPTTTHPTTRSLSASFTKISIWTSSTCLPTPSPKPPSTWKIYAVCYSKVVSTSRNGFLPMKLS